eukprot:scaffold77871_cov62-Phaeocystis_antarctica.AAC.6
MVLPRLVRAVKARLVPLVWQLAGGFRVFPRAVPAQQILLELLQVVHVVGCPSVVVQHHWVSPCTRKLGLQHHGSGAAVSVNEWVQLRHGCVESGSGRKQATESCSRVRIVIAVRDAAILLGNGLVELVKGILDQ